MIRKLGQVDRDIPDPYNTEYFTHLELFVPKPTREAPFPCIIISIRNGQRKLFFRLADVDSYIKAFELSARERERLIAALVRARAEAAELAEDERLAWLRRAGAGHQVAGGNKTLLIT